jgi:chemotaxis protein methyltransferase CheR
MADLYLSQKQEMTDADLKKISSLVYDLSGINLNEGKKELVKARLGKRMRSGQFRSFGDYYRHVLQDQTGQELVYLLDSLATNFTHFFREAKHFDFLRKELVPELTSKKKGNGHKLRFWSAGCSSGEEPYSLGITLLENLKNLELWDLKILATDLSTKVLKTAASGIYSRERIRSIPPDLVKKYFLRGDHSWRDYVKVKDALKKYISFERLNLKGEFSFSEPFDCIFCRNVMIYFDKQTQNSLVNRFYACLAKGGILFIGHSESLTGIQHRFRYLKPAVYQKEE